MFKRTLFAIVAALGTLAFAASAQAAYMTLGTTNTSNAPTILTGSTAGPELKVVNGNASNQAITAQNSGAGSGIAVFGLHSSAGGTGAAVQGSSASTAANAFSLYGLISSTSPGVGSAAVRGRNNGTGANGYGVWGSQAGSGTGVYGYAPHGRGVAGFSDTFQGVFGHSTANAGVVGESTNFDGVYGVAHTSTYSAVSGHNDAGGYAIWGGASGGGTAIYGVETGIGDDSTNAIHGNTEYGSGVKGSSTYFTGVTGYGPYGVVGVTSNGTWGGWFTGNVKITGTCTGCTGPSALQIDHPLDPAHKYLQHSSVASSQQLDIYSGNVTTNEKGFATVTMPRWFQALNRSFRYQLTPVGHRAWGAQAIVWDRIKANRFTIRSRPRVEISWQVTAVRHDRYANAHSVRVVVPKPKAERGKYLHPELYGKPRSQAIGYQKPPRLPRRPISKR